jgi:hypothetical protein
MYKKMDKVEKMVYEAMLQGDIDITFADISKANNLLGTNQLLV